MINDLILHLDCNRFYKEILKHSDFLSFKRDKFDLRHLMQEISYIIIYHKSSSFSLEFSFFFYKTSSTFWESKDRDELYTYSETRGFKNWRVKQLFDSPGQLDQLSSYPRWPISKTIKRLLLYFWPVLGPLLM